MTQSRHRSPAPVLVVAALSMYGCNVGPDYAPPATDAPPSWSESDLSKETSNVAPVAPVDPAWWNTLGDPKLTELVEQALAANLDLRIAVARVQETRALRGVVAAAGLPTLDSNAGYLRYRDSENARSGFGFDNQDAEGVDQYQVGLDASWEIDVFGGIRRSVEAATADVQAAEESRRDVQVMVVAEVARNYVDVRGLQRRIDVLRSNIAIQADTLQISQSRFDAGLTSELDVAQAQAQLETTTAALPLLEAAMRQAIHRVGVLLGRPPAEKLAELLEPAPIPAAPSEVPIGLPSELVRRRPDIRRSERELAASTARVGEATADLFPRFSITGSFGLRSDQIGDLPDGDSRFWSIGPALRWPIFQGGRIKNSILAQEARTAVLLASYEQTVLIAFEDVENALVTFNRQQARRTSLTRAVSANRRAVELASDLNSAGLTDFERVLDSQRSLAISEEALAASEQEVVQALIRLYKALGGGWEVGYVAEPPVTSDPADDQPAATAAP